MSTKPTDNVFQLVKSLNKGEKRNFKLYVQRNTQADNLKTVVLFDALDKLQEYDDILVLKKATGITKQQLSNTKAALYKQILSSLKLLNDSSNIDILLHEQLDFAKILYNKGLYLQALKILDKLKDTAKQNEQITYQLQAIILEKKIEALHITRSINNRAELLSAESDAINKRLSLIGTLSNLALQLYGWYVQHGHARDKRDEQAIKIFFDSNMPAYNIGSMDFYERLYLYQSYTWYCFILQDLFGFYRYTQKWLDLFEEKPMMKPIESGQYIRGLHNVLTACFTLNNYKRFVEVLKQFEKFATLEQVVQNENATIQSFVYLYLNKINKHFLEGTFSDGIVLVPIIEEKLKQYELHLDRHRVLVFYYKIACLYFGSGDNDKAVHYLNKIIQLKVDLRTDLQCYARLLHLIAHYELGNYNLLEYLIKSVYRFMSKMNNLSVVEEEVFKFIKKSFGLTTKKLTPAFISLKEKLEKLQQNSIESRSFMYLDIIAWLQSKIEQVPVQRVQRKKFLASRRSGGQKGLEV
jgi:hypothetical protein